MATNCTAWAWTKASDVDTPAMLVVLLKLADMAHDDGKSWPSHAYLAGKTGLSERTVRAAIAGMEGRFLRTEPRAGRTDIIWLLVEAVTLDPVPRGEMEAGPRGRPKNPGNLRQTPEKCGETPARIADEPKIEPKTEATEGLTPLVAGGDASPARQAFDAWNEFAEAKGKAKALKLNDQRRRALNARLKECGGVVEWRRVISEIPSSAFLMGSTHHRFVISLDFLLQPSSFVKLLEGRYHGQQQSSGAGSARSAERLNAYAKGLEDSARDFLGRHGGG